MKNKIVFITGASSGIGAATAKEFSKLGYNLILAARRVEKLKQISQTLTTEYKNKILTLALDVQNQSLVTETIHSLQPEWQPIDILVNNAGLALGLDKLQQGKISDWDTMIKTNVSGLLYVTQAVLPLMLANASGHIINIGSIASHEYYPGGNVYAATKHAVRALSQGMRIDLLGTGVRVSEIDPGAAETEFSIVRFNDEAKAKDCYKDYTPLTPEDIAEAIIYVATRHPKMNIAEMIILSSDQASANHIHRTK